jgi:hypothetical protein
MRFGKGTRMWHSLAERDRPTPRFNLSGQPCTDGIEHLIFHLAPGGASALVNRRDCLQALDGRLAGLIEEIVKATERIADAQQKCKKSEAARQEVTRFAAAGALALDPLQKDAGRLEGLTSWTQERRDEADALTARLAEQTLPELSAPTLAARLPGADRLAALRDQSAAVASGLHALQSEVEAVREEARAAHERQVAAVQSALVAAGGKSTDLQLFADASRSAQHHESYKAALHALQENRDQLIAQFKTLRSERADLTDQQRTSLRPVCEQITARYAGRVVVNLVEDGDRRQIDAWVKAIKKAGITRWWNDVGSKKATSRQIGDLTDLLSSQREGGADPATARRIAADMGMSDAVATSLIEHLGTGRTRLEAQALRSPDTFEILWVEGGQRPLDQLSGGKRLAVLLSLLLDADDPTPLIIDQPEDQLDNRFLNETIIPALHRLKGRRQVIFATHNANLVVNGDADQVIALEADANQAQIAEMGAIESPPVREAILSTLDGGKEAFRLRQAKYGF